MTSLLLVLKHKDDVVFCTVSGSELGWHESRGHILQGRKRWERQPRALAGAGWGVPQRQDLGQVWVPTPLRLVWFNNPVRDMNDSG